MEFGRRPMAYRQSHPLVKVVILAIVVWAGYHFGVPWAREQGLLGGTTREQGATPNAACVTAVDDAVAVWSRGLVRFVDPPVDTSAWSDFRVEVERKIEKGRAACDCPAESCALAKEIASDLRRVLSEMDAAARSGGSPAVDLVRAQESIDLKIEQAWVLADSGK
jgi:hypothetical protein